MPAEFAFFGELGHAVTLFKSIIVACTTFHFYYTVTHFDEEVEYIWSRKWTAAKIMYLLTRYLGAIFLICSVIGVGAYAWNDSDISKYLTSAKELTLDNFIPSCFGGQLYAGFGPMIILSAEVILQMRVYALYGRDKRLLAFFVLLTIALLGFNILQMSRLFLDVEENRCATNGGCLHERNIFRGIFISKFVYTNYACVYAHRVSGIAWSVTAFTEFLLFILVVIKARKGRLKIRKQLAAQDTLARMANGSITYFAALFTVCLIGAVIVFIGEHFDNNFFVLFVYLQTNSYETIAITIMTILAPKLIISIRAEFYGPPDANETQLTWNADAAGSFSSNGSAWLSVTASNNGDDESSGVEGSRRE